MPQQSLSGDTISLTFVNTENRSSEGGKFTSLFEETGLFLLTTETARKRRGLSKKFVPLRSMWDVRNWRLLEKM